MSGYAYNRRQLFVRVGNDANDKDIGHFIVPARRVVELFGMKAVVGTAPNTGNAVKVEVVNSANVNVCDVAVSPIGSTNLINSGDTFPITLTNNTDSDILYKFRMDGAGDSNTNATVILDASFPGKL